ncbi:hypothetical protein [Pseudomonas cannabina]|uniref:Uncharacterized protein n=1 Tax=Pseudomonas cannabina TaxID=86840 RepID=A0A0P9M507_PSECA|nr:hypothetical protein [Pseudomonas cannabina]KAA8712940.1 hypothetical protein F4W70_10090 [Pseudomonas cannabina]KPW78612.1 Uncharacterized protein ALO81_00396 [Pseudomonas cannabina]RMN20790.1 hypothetical protein ALQ64_02392 [Pseudomonas cannabina]SDR04406.1 hypothetical protein SAMN05216597_2088 [Pseudomonas cannabina]
MALVKNTHRKTPIGLPDGSVVPPRGELDVPHWADYRDRQNLAFYVDTGVLVVEGDDEQPQPSKEELLARLKALGIEAGKNSGIETLQKRLAEAEDAAEKQKVIDELTELQVEFDKEANLEALQAALAAAKA